MMFGIAAAGASHANARAEEASDRSVQPPEAREPHPLTFVGHVGIGTPLGFAGFAVEYNPAPFLTLAGGVGLGNEGAQFALMPRVRPFDDMLALGLGISEGPHSWRSCSVLCFGAVSNKLWDHAVWANVDLSLEGRGGFAWRWYLGGGRLLNPAAYRCQRGISTGWLGGTTTGPECHDDEGLWMMYVGASFGASP